MRSCYYLSNVRHDRFALEVRYLLPCYHEFGDLSNYIVVSSFFDVRVRSCSCSSSSSFDDLNIRRGGAAATAGAGTITAWSTRDDAFGYEEEKGKTTLIEELGRATFAEEQDCKHVQDLIKKANDLMSSMVSAALQRPDKFMPSLYYEEENDDSVVVDIALSNLNHKQDQFASKKDKDYSLLNDDNHNPPHNNEKIHSMLAQLAEDTNRLFYSNYKKR
jgi:hypothetical protein